MLVFRVLAFLWPFLKEMFLGDKSLLEALKKHKGRVFIVGVIFLSIILNFFAIPRLFEISAQHVILKKEYADLKRQIESKPPDEPPPPPIKPQSSIDGVVSDKSNGVTVPTSEPPRKRKPDMESTRYKKTKETFDRIREREERENHDVLSAKR